MNAFAGIAALAHSFSIITMMLCYCQSKLHDVAEPSTLLFVIDVVVVVVLCIWIIAVCFSTCTQPCSIEHDTRGPCVLPCLSP
jgi:hypothetical protein